MEKMSIQKYVPNYMSCKWKQRDSIAHLLEGAKTEHWQLNDQEDRDQQELSFAAGGNAQWFGLF